MQSFIASALIAIATIGAVSAAPAALPQTDANIKAPTCPANSKWDNRACRPTACPDGSSVLIDKVGVPYCQCSASGTYWNMYTNECRVRLDDAISGNSPKAYQCDSGYTFQLFTGCVKN